MFKNILVISGISISKLIPTKLSPFHISLDNLSLSSRVQNVGSIIWDSCLSVFIPLYFPVSERYLLFSHVWKASILSEFQEKPIHHNLWGGLYHVSSSLKIYWKTDTDELNFFSPWHHKFQKSLQMHSNKKMLNCQTY